MNRKEIEKQINSDVDSAVLNSIKTLKEKYPNMFSTEPQVDSLVGIANEIYMKIEKEFIAALEARRSKELHRQSQFKGCGSMDILEGVTIS